MSDILTKASKLFEVTDLDVAHRSLSSMRQYVKFRKNSSHLFVRFVVESKVPHYKKLVDKLAEIRKMCVKFGKIDNFLTELTAIKQSQKNRKKCIEMIKEFELKNK